MNKILYLKEIPTTKKILGFTLTFISLLAFLLSNILFGAIFIVIGLNFLVAEGSEIDLQNKTYRNIKSLLGMHFGKWKPCPKFEYISVFKTKQNQIIRVVTAEAIIQSDVILVNLFYEGNKHITFFRTNDKTEAFRVAEEIKTVFGIDILDATGSEKKMTLKL
jgi:hypothetical protein